MALRRWNIRSKKYSWVEGDREHSVLSKPEGNCSEIRQPWYLKEVSRIRRKIQQKGRRQENQKSIAPILIFETGPRRKMSFFQSRGISSTLGSHGESKYWNPPHTKSGFCELRNKWGSEWFGNSIIHKNVKYHEVGSRRSYLTSWLLDICQSQESNHSL